ncbi:hypothetical protein D2T31_12610 [Sinirhodobacter populi]|uniref:Uncharacterized protein n=1 Tax=Paenirhodobacter populi TaxID=2306993 RepID=A0A443K888_9RHOB|nr:hypothetical protein [Sinirhodobacter populi]RWR28942.1 hypothetical protein D2T31_12610 [Sinirhodobacter populi]
MRTGYRTSAGGFDLLGLRRRQGAVEIVYDDGVMHRKVLRVSGFRTEAQLDEALAHAAREVRVLPALYAELRKRAITIEAVSG